MACIFQGCAVGLGFCATSHLDAVLTKLENVTKNDMTKKSGGLLSFMKVSIPFCFFQNKFSGIVH